MEKFDVAICGYGPVGATLSLLLAKYNYKVLIIEKNQGPCKTARAINTDGEQLRICLLYTSPSPRDCDRSRMPSSA